MTAVLDQLWRSWLELDYLKVEDPSILSGSEALSCRDDSGQDFLVKGQRGNSSKQPTVSYRMQQEKMRRLLSAKKLRQESGTTASLAYKVGKSHRVEDIQKLSYTNQNIQRSQQEAIIFQDDWCFTEVVVSRKLEWLSIIAWGSTFEKNPFTHREGHLGQTELCLQTFERLRWVLSSLHMSDGAKQEPFGPMDAAYIWRKKRDPLHPNNTVPTVKHRIESIMLWNCLQPHA